MTLLGQTARAGNKRRPEWRDIIKKLPKRRGYAKNRGRTVDGTLPDAIAISLELLEKTFDAGAELFVTGIETYRYPVQPIVPVALDSV